ncbi:MAG: phage holin family protein [Tenericutes bacterium]|nr:phage holin family protein [Mycoplasmatota bacterium]
MKLIIKEKNVTRINKVIEWLIYMIGYTLVLILVSSMFKSVYIDKDHFLIYAILIELVLYVLNKTLKPILFTITIPITGITLGLFYPFINLFILKLADWIFGSHFQLENIYIAFFVAILISIMNLIVEGLIGSIIKKVKHHE